LLEVLGSQTGIPKGLKKIGNSNGEEERLIILEFGGHGGRWGRAFWNFQRQGEFKMLMPSVVGYGYFLESPIESTVTY